MAGGKLFSKSLKCLPANGGGGDVKTIYHGQHSQRAVSIQQAAIRDQNSTIYMATDNGTNLARDHKR